MQRRPVCGRRRFTWMRRAMRPARWLIAAVAVLSVSGLAARASAQSPSFELEGLIAGDEAPRAWYSARGHIEADTETPALHCITFVFRAGGTPRRYVCSTNAMWSALAYRRIGYPIGVLPARIGSAPRIFAALACVSMVPRPTNTISPIAVGWGRPAIQPPIEVSAYLANGAA